MATEVMEIPASKSQHTDPITAYWEDLGPGEGRVTLICWGSAWTSYWRAMGDDTIQQFIASCDLGYLLNKFGCNDVLRRDARSRTYLARVLTAVREHLKSTTPAPAHRPPNEESIVVL